MHIKEFFPGFVKPGKEQNERAKGKMKALFSKAINKADVSNCTLLYGNFEKTQDFVVVSISSAKSYIIGFDEIKMELILVPFKSDFSKFADPIYLLPNNLKKATKSFVGSYHFKDNNNKTYKMHIPAITGNVTAFFSQDQIAIDQKDELLKFKEFYKKIST